MSTQFTLRGRIARAEEVRTVRCRSVWVVIVKFWESGTDETCRDQLEWPAFAFDKENHAVPGC